MFQERYNRIVLPFFFFLQIFWPVPKFEIIFFGLRQFRWLNERFKQKPNQKSLILATMTQWILGFEAGTEVANLANLQKNTWNRIQSAAGGPHSRGEDTPLVTGTAWTGPSAGSGDPGLGSQSRATSHEETIE